MQKKFADLESPNRLKVTMGHGAKAWVSDFNHPHYMAGRKAMKTGLFKALCSLIMLNIPTHKSDDTYPLWLSL